jgi:hypothetical protein
MTQFYGRTFWLGVVTVLATTEATAQSPMLHWGWDSRTMSQPECVRRAQWAMGEKGLRVVAANNSAVAGSGGNVSVLVTCKAEGSETFITVVGASPDSGAAERGRNDIRSLVMGPK